MDIRQILSANLTYRLDSPTPAEAEIEALEKNLGTSLPPSFREFLLLGGLNDLRFKNQFLGLNEIAENREFLPDRLHIPFASNGCGDLFCWPIGCEEPQVVFWDHQSNVYSLDAQSFILWLVANRF